MADQRVVVECGVEAVGSALVTATAVAFAFRPERNMVVAMFTMSILVAVMEVVRTAARVEIRRMSAAGTTAESPGSPKHEAPVRLRTPAKSASAGESDDDRQCPRCGGYSVSAMERNCFVCTSCATTWSWKPGEPWPDVVVRLGYRNAPTN